MPRVVNDLVALEAAPMVGATGPRIDAVAFVIGHDQAGRAGPNRLPKEAVEGPTQFDQARPLFLEGEPSTIAKPSLDAAGQGR